MIFSVRRRTSLVSSENADGSTGELTASQDLNWELGLGVLRELLRSHNGRVSSTALRRELERNHGIIDAGPLLVELTYFNAELNRERGLPVPEFRFHHLGRSFYSEEKYAEQEEATTEEAEDASREASEAPVDNVAEAETSRTNRQDEARLVKYVKTKLEELYSSDFVSDEKKYVFDVHSSRAGGSFENVDLLAVHFLTRNVCELISVEVKLEFGPQVVQQALNYARFSHRAWVAVAVQSSPLELRALHPALFEYAISRGLGLLACRRRQGGRYEVDPVHWPLLSQPDRLEQEEFIERYRDELEQAGVVEAERRSVPKLR
jgi:hypothetical protein